MKKAVKIRLLALPQDFVERKSSKVNSPLNVDSDASDQEGSLSGRVRAFPLSWSFSAKILILVLYAALVVWLNLNHEPWRDEAEAWLSARDNGFIESLALARYEGHPRLWHLILAPFAKLGFPFWSIKVINVAFALLSGFLLIFFAPFNLVVRVLILFSYLFSYEYPVLARSYQASVFLVFLLAYLHDKRSSRPIIYSSVIGLLANTSILGLIVALSIFAADFLTVKGKFNWLRTTATPALCGISLAIYLLTPPTSGGQPLCTSVQFSWPVVDLAIRNAFMPAAELIDHCRTPEFLAVDQMIPWLILIGLSLSCCMIHMRNSRWAQVVLILSWSLLLALFVFKFTGTIRHWGFLAVVLFYSLWITGLESKDKSEQELVDKYAQIWTWTFLVGTLILSNISAAGAWFKEVHEPFSGAREMAEFINREERTFRTIPIAGYYSFQCESVVPFLKRKTIYYPALGKFSSHMPWFDGTTFNTLNTEQLFERIDREFGETGKVLLLLSEGSEIKSDALEANGFKLIFKNKIAPLTSDERFYLYLRN